MSTAGFGAPATTGGFGAASTTGGFGAKAPGGGFGAPATTGGFGGASTTGGFGAASTTGGFGAKAPGGGFGAPTTTGGFGAASTTGGFGAKAPGGGFGAPATTGGFGAAAAPASQPETNPFARPAGGQGAAIVGQYLLQWDNVYNADHTECKFREFFYNVCIPGQAELAIQRERLGPQLRGNPGCREEQWIIARRENPAPDHMYPTPIHFMVGLKQRSQKQQEQIAAYHTHVTQLLGKLRELRALHDDNVDRRRKLLLKESLIEGRLLRAMSRAEVFRQSGLKLGQERYTVAQRCTASLRKLHDITETLEALEPLTAEGTGFSDDTASAIAGMASTTTIEYWTRFVDRNEAGIEKLQRSVRGDLRVVDAILRRLESMER